MSIFYLGVLYLRRRFILNRIDRSSDSDTGEKRKEKKSKKKTEKKTQKKQKNNDKVNRKKSHPILRLFWNLFLIIFVAILVLGVLFYQKTISNGGGVQGALCTIFGQSVDDLDDLKPINILILGVSEDISSELTDTIIVCNYNPRNSKTNNAFDSKRYIYWKITTNSKRL